MNVQRIEHQDGDPGVEQTIRAMRRLIQRGRTEPEIRELAAKILRSRGVSAFNWDGEARAIYEWVRKNIRFTRDVYSHETLTAPADTVRLGIGDCDDFTVLICSLMGTIGADCRIVTIGTDSRNYAAARGAANPEFCHVYPEVLISGRWIPMDAARRNPEFGKGPERYTRKRWWAIDSEEYADMSGIRTSIAPGQGPAGAWRANVYSPFRTAAIAATGTYLPKFPVAPPSQRRRRPPLGLGNYGQRAIVRGLGDDWDAGDIASVITAGTTGAANIITAERASPYNLVPTTSVNGQRSTALLSPAAILPTSTIGGIGTGTLLIGAALLGVVLLARR